MVVVLVSLKVEDCRIHVEMTIDFLDKESFEAT